LASYLGSIHGCIIPCHAETYGTINTFATIPVLWTLEVEIAFYLIIALASGMVGRIGFKSIIFIAFFCVFYITLIGTPFITGLASPITLDRLSHLGSLLVHINFMLVGSVIYRGFSDKKPKIALIVGIFVFTLYIVCFNIFQIVSNGRNIGVALPDVCLALVIFLIAFWTSSYGLTFSILQWIGTISYPLYLVHVPLGWGVLALLGGIGWNMNVAALTSVIVVTFVAWTLHLNVELPAQNMGKKIANYFRLNSPVFAQTKSK
jgi:peptidoglycan/LPS O-acetylase OafA/YrhL